MRPDRTRGIAAVIAISFLAACSASEPDAPASAVAEVAEEGSSNAADGELFTEREAVTAVDDDGQPVQPVTESLPPVPETGVPGIDSEDAFCRAWSTYAGSVQALSLAWALQPALEAATLEVSATDAVSEAVETMGAELPSEIESNRQALTVDVPGPFLRRAERGRQFLVDAGLDDNQIAQLGERWVDAITEQGIDSESLTIEVPAESESALDAAGEQLVAELPPIIEDPTLDTTAFDVSPSLDYIFENCPDRGTLAGNDVIDSGGS